MPVSECTNVPESYPNIWKIRILVGGWFVVSLAPVTLSMLVSDRITVDLTGATPVSVSGAKGMYWIGASLGCLIIVPLFDRLGRRTPMYVMFALGVLSTLFNACSTSIHVYGLTLFLSGFTIFPAIMACYLLWQESSPEHVRSVNMVLGNVGFSIFSVMMAIFGKFTQHLNWRLETFLIFIPWILLLAFGPCFISESNEFQRMRASSLEKAFAEKSDSAGMCELFGRGLFCTTAATLLCWTAASFIYYGLTYCAGTLSTDMYTNMALLGLTDIIAYAGPALWKYDMRSLQTLAFVGTAAALLICSVLPHGSQASLICALAGRLFVDFAFTTVYLLVVECYPTRIRSAATGFANAVARASGLLAPFMSLIPFEASCQILGVVGLMAALATRSLRPFQDGTHEGLLLDGASLE